MAQTEDVDNLWVALGVFFAVLMIISICVVYLFWKVHKIDKKLNERDVKKDEAKVQTPTCNILVTPPVEVACNAERIYTTLASCSSESRLDVAGHNLPGLPPRTLNKSISSLPTSKQMTLPTVPPKAAKSKSEDKLIKPDDFYLSMHLPKPQKQNTRDDSMYLDMTGAFGKPRNRAGTEPKVVTLHCSQPEML